MRIQLFMFKRSIMPTTCTSPFKLTNAKFHKSNPYHLKCLGQMAKIAFSTMDSIHDGSEIIVYIRQDKGIIVKADIFRKRRSKFTSIFDQWQNPTFINLRTHIAFVRLEIRKSHHFKGETYFFQNIFTFCGWF